MRSLLKILILLFILFVTVDLIAQSIRRSVVTGQVLDAKSGKPLEMVNVFLSNTTFGSATGANGEFKIANIPPGSYDLIISHVGYQLKRIALQFMRPDSQHYIIKLDSIVYEAEKITVEAREPKEWKKDLKKFTKIFLGKTENAKKCKILNPEVLEFKYDKINNAFIAQTDSLLRVRNEALGYQLDIVLQRFKYMEQNDAVQYVIFPRFRELKPRNEKERKKWLENRLKCYEGSFKHFISSLARGTLRKERFEVYHTMNLRLKGYKVYPEEKGFVIPDSNGFKRLQFENFLSVYYKPPDDVIYNTWIDALYKETEKSFIKLNTPYVLIDTLGNVYAHFPITIYGEWSKLGIADLLPFDFAPKNF